ncbi:uncharacterized protein LOC101208991 isoform X2 [Cucumis sativus]|uniref:uncharacterized protein LOC101208991 isoform X2 n=1 Tax=Cucumis sativus TaxID=3659 RepID=UPI0012F4E9E9|nr:uncharacterized protein LOC101208991 isoform X2 [Cucumis sativus]
MADSSSSYMHMVQHLIEKCLIFHMTKEECMDALSKHADIKPIITSTEIMTLGNSTVKTKSIMLLLIMHDLIQLEFGTRNHQYGMN